MYKPKPFRPRRLRHLWWAPLALLAVVLILLGIVWKIYSQNLKPVSNSQQVQIFTVQKGDALAEIAVNLQKAKLIRSDWAFRLYVTKKGLANQLQAGTYALSPDQGTVKVATVMTKGRVSTQLVTILPGRRIDQVRADLINYGFAPADVDAALKPAMYKDLPVMALVPPDVNSLEGLLWPDSFQKDAASKPQDIIRQSLSAMGDRLTPDVQAAFKAQGLSAYDGLKLASIVVQEVDKSSDRAQAAQVFLSRLRGGIKLGSDVTARYGSITAGRAPDLGYDSPYNTHLYTGLPPTPISSIDATSLDAAAHPAATDWLFFVTGDDGTTHFSRTIQEHEALIKQYCRKLCGN